MLALYLLTNTQNDVDVLNVLKKVEHCEEHDRADDGHEHHMVTGEVLYTCVSMGVGVWEGLCGGGFGHRIPSAIGLSLESRSSFTAL